MSTFDKIKKSPVAMISLIISAILLVGAFVVKNQKVSQLMAMGIGILLVSWSMANFISYFKTKDRSALLIGVLGIISGVLAIISNLSYIL